MSTNVIVCQFGRKDVPLDADGWKLY